MSNHFKLLKIEHKNYFPKFLFFNLILFFKIKQIFYNYKQIIRANK